MYSKTIRLTFFAHGFHRVCEEIRMHFPEVDRLVSNMKNKFVKAPSRIAKFKEKLPNIPLPSQPILKRWGTWVTVVNYYCNYFDELKNVVDEFDERDAASIQICKELIQTTKVKFET